MIGERLAEGLNTMRRIFAVVLLLALLAGCGAQSNPNLPSGARLVSISNFPPGIGGGYPQGLLNDSGAPQMLRKGDTPPNFILLLPDGRYTTLADLKGQQVLINFWATWCPPCRAEMPELLQAARDYPELVLLAINVAETPDKVSQFAEQFRMDAPVVIDPQGAISDRYNVRGLPTSIFLDADGTIMEVRPGAINRAVIDSMLQR
ncbi:MAG: TlpA family protein disulfide reductase [Caldilinea sp.]